MPHIACLTLTWNRLEMTKQCFKSMYEKAGIEFDHFIIDNGSADGTQQWLRNQFAKGQFQGILLNKLNKGIIPAQNQLFETLKDYDYIIRTDNDVEYLTDRWLGKCIDIMTMLDNKAVLCPTIKGLDKPLTPLPNKDPIEVKGLDQIYTVLPVGGIGGFWVCPKNVWRETYDIGFSYKHDFKDFNKVINIACKKKFIIGMIKEIEIFHDSLGQPRQNPDYHKLKQQARKDSI